MFYLSKRFLSKLLLSPRSADANPEVLQYSDPAPLLSIADVFLPDVEILRNMEEKFAFLSVFDGQTYALARINYAKISDSVLFRSTSSSSTSSFVVKPENDGQEPGQREQQNSAEEETDSNAAVALSQPQCSQAYDFEEKQLIKAGCVFTVRKLHIVADFRQFPPCQWMQKHNFSMQNFDPISGK